MCVLSLRLDQGLGVVTAWSIVPFFISMTAVAVIAQNEPSVSPRTLGRGAQSGIGDARRVIVHSPTEWEALWGEHTATQELPTVDWDHEMVVGLFMGRKMTGGFGIEIRGAEIRSKTLVIRYREVTPAAGAVTAQMLTAPYHVVAVPAWAGDVTFEVVP